MPAEFDKCVQKVMGQGKSKSSAFAICTATFKKAGKKFKDNFEMEEKIDEKKEIKLDEDGDIIVAENVPIIIEGSIDIIEE